MSDDSGGHAPTPPEKPKVDEQRSTDSGGHAPTPPVPPVKKPQ